MRLRVLLVDDDDVYWKLIQEAFRRSPALAETSLSRLSDGSEVLAYLSRESPYDDIEAYPWPDIVLLDERMTRMDGVETLAAMRARGVGQTVSVSLMTSAQEPELVARALSQGARFCFTKPLEFDGLVEIFARIISFYRDIARLPPIPK